MSWSIYATGTKAGVQKKVEAATIADPFADVEKQQFAKAKELVLFTLENIEANAENGKGFKVEASGSHSEYGPKDGPFQVSNSVKVSIETIAFEH